MRKTTSSRLIGLAFVSLLGVTACGSDSDTAASTGVTAATTDTSSPEKNVDLDDKVSGFSFDLNAGDMAGGVRPAPWAGTAGWEAQKDADPNGHKAENLVHFGNYTGSFNVTEGTPRVTSLVVVDAKGDVVYSGDGIEGSTAVARTYMTKLWQDGKGYLAFAQSATLAPSADSLQSEGAAVTSVHVLDENLKEVYVETFNDGTQVSITEGAVALRYNEGDISAPPTVIDLATGEASDLSQKTGTWLGRIDGQDVFRETREITGEFGFTTDQDLIVSEKWEKPLNVAAGTIFEVGELGPLAQVNVSSEEGGVENCVILNPHTGEEIDLGTNGSCVDAISVSPDGNVIAFAGIESAGDGLTFVEARNSVAAVKEGKTYQVPENIEFEVTAVTNDGDVYGQGAGKVAHMNLFEDSEPEVLGGVTSSPASISGGGLAEFGSFAVVPDA